MSVRSQSFTPCATKSGDKLTGSLEAKYMFPGNIEAEATLNTSGVLSASLEVVDAITKGLTASIECETLAPGKTGVLGSGKCTFDFKQDAFTTKASYDYYKGDFTGAPLACPRAAPAVRASSRLRGHRLASTIARLRAAL